MIKIFSSLKLRAHFLIISSLFIVPGCMDSQDLGTRHQTRLEKAYRDVSFEYEREFEILVSEKEVNDINKSSLHQEILVKNDTYNKRYPGNDSAQFPYFQYNTRLDRDIYRLENAITKSTLAEDELQEKARALLKKLRKIKRLIVTNPTYQQEQKQKAKVDAQYAIARATDRSALATVYAGHTVAGAVERAPRGNTDVVVNIHEEQNIYE